jgi:hypothetical protein
MLSLAIAGILASLPATGVLQAFERLKLEAEIAGH